MAQASQAALAQRPAGSRMSLARLSPRAVAWIKAIAFVLALGPLARLVAGVFMRALGTNPVEVIIRSLGTWTLVFLCITLAVTPLRKLTGWHWLLRLRRMFGLYAFFYGVLHFTSYVWLDQDLDFARDPARHPQAAVHHGRLHLPAPDAAARRDLDRRDGQAARVEAMDRAAPVRIRDCHRRGGSLLVAGEARRHRAGDLCLRGRRSARVSSGRGAALPAAHAEAGYFAMLVAGRRLRRCASHCCSRSK